MVSSFVSESDYIIMCYWKEIELWFLMVFKIRYEGQRDQLYSQTFNLEQVAFATEGIKDAQQTVTTLHFSFRFSSSLSVDVITVHNDTHCASSSVLFCNSF